MSELAGPGETLRGGEAQPRPPARGTRARLRALLLGGVGVLYVLSIPWYRAPAEAPPVWLGVPDWVAVALGCYVGVAILNACAWLLTEVPDPAPEEGDEEA